MLPQLQYWARSVRAGQSFRRLFSPGLTSSGTCIPCAASNATERGCVFHPPGMERDLIRPNSLWARNLRALRRMRLRSARARLAVTHFSFQRSIKMRTPANIAKHPIHPMLIPIPIGLWIFSLVCDLIQAAGSADPAWPTVALYTMGGGIVDALAAAVPGLWGRRRHQLQCDTRPR